MKLTAFILLIGCMHAAATGHSQGVTITLKNVPLEKAFTAIEKESGYYFTYTKEQMEGTKNVSLDVRNADIKDVLELCFNAQPVTYEMIDKAVVVKKRVNVNVTSTTLPEFFVPITGVITDSTGKPLQGANIEVKGTKKRTTTDSEGRFVIDAKEGDVLVVSYVGYEKAEVRLGSEAAIRIALKVEITEIKGVTVSTGYQTINRERVVGSVVTIDSALFNRTITTDFISRLEGIAPGLLFIDKATGTPRIQIRGLSTLSLNLVSAEPLIIVDNFPYYDDLNNINPNDVETITILKDAAAASVWGARAGNGVIVVTTKKGRYNQPFRLTASTSLRVQEKPNLFYYPQMNTSDFIDVEQFLFSKGYYDADLSNNTTWPVVSPVVELLAKQRAGSLSAYEADAAINSLRSLDVRNDFDQYVYRAGISRQDYLNFNGGTNNLRYALSLGWDQNQNNMKDDGGYNRYSINSSTSFKPFRALEINLGLGLTQGETRNGGNITYPISAGGGKGVLYPYAQLADAYGNPLPVTKDRRTAFIDTIGRGQLLDWHYRPLDEMRLQSNRTKTRGIRLNLGANLKLTSWLDAAVLWGYMQQTMATRGYGSPESYFVRDLINRYSQLNGATVTRPIPLGGILGVNNGENLTNNLRGQLNFNKNWGSRHSVTALVAGEIGVNKSSANANRFYGYNDAVVSYATGIDYATFFPQLIGGASVPIPSGATYSEGLVSRTASLLANASYAYLDRYRLYASARKDGANIFGVNTNDKWKPLWSIGAGWDISKEGFYGMDWMSLLRLRVSYGYTGNASNRLSAITTLITLGNSPYTQLPISGVNNPPNPDLRWEQVGTVNVGVDFSAFKDRISGSLEWFQKNSRDVLAQAPVDPITGLRFVTFNYANLRGRGVELVLNSKNIESKNFQWASSFNFTHNKTIITKYYGDFTQTPITYGINPREGGLAYALYSYKWMGLDPANGDPQGYLNGHASKDYQGIMNDSFQNQVYHGSSIPLYFGNLLNSFSFKGFSVSFNITYKFDYYFRKTALKYTDLLGWGGHIDYGKRWQQAGDEARTNVPSMVYPIDGRRDEFYANSAINVERGDNIRLENIQIALPAWENRKGNGFPIRSARLSLIPAQLNLFLWRASKSGLDPDYSGSSFLLPPAKVWAVALNINFK